MTQEKKFYQWRNYGGVLEVGLGWTEGQTVDRQIGERDKLRQVSNKKCTHDFYGILHTSNERDGEIVKTDKQTRR